MKKQAILIIAHNNLEILKKNILILDNSNIDFYIHIDKKSSIEINDILKDNQLLDLKSNIYIYKEISVYWGGYSQIQVELFLLKQAIINSNNKSFEYGHLHLISGVDLPLVNSDYFVRFFNENSNKEFIHFYSKKLSNKIYDRFDYYHFFEENLWKRKGIGKILYKILNNFSKLFQKLIFINRVDNNISYQYGCNWFSITSDFANYVINKENFIYKNFKKSVCCDEVFLQTVFINSEFKENLYIKDYNDNYKTCMRFIDWNRGNPYIFKKEDYELLVKSDYIFARKFDMNVNSEIVDLIYNFLKEEK